MPPRFTAQGGQGVEKVGRCGREWRGEGKKLHKREIFHQGSGVKGKSERDHRHRGAPISHFEAQISPEAQG
jgi:hypothetical protein